MPEKSNFNGADALVKTLDELGVECVFGLPGSQNIALFESLRTAKIRTVLAASETAAGFMANGLSRASGHTGVFLGIAGPGFAWAVPPLAEAALDSAAIMLLTPKPLDRGYRYDLQVIAQEAMATALNCAFFAIDDSESVNRTIKAAWAAARERGPRPVVVQIAAEVLRETVPSPGTVAAASAGPATAEPTIPEEFVEHWCRAARPVVFAGAGTLDYAQRLERLVAVTGAAVFTTPSARGVIREDHPLCLRADLLSDRVDILNDFLGSADAVLALGCRFSHNGTGGFGLEIAAANLLHVDLDSEVLGANYPARWALCMDIGDFLSGFLGRIQGAAPAIRQQASVAACRERLRAARQSVVCEPVWAGHGNCEDLFAQIRDGIQDDGILVTDTGLHQILARTHLDALSPRGLIFPSDFQSMGFGLPAAIGASLALPERSVTALIGDGSLLMVGGELATASREQLSLPVLVFRDGYLGQIRMQQLENYGHESATVLQDFDLEAYARSLGAEYVLAGANLAAQLRLARDYNGPTIVEVRLADSRSLGAMTRRVRRKNALKSAVSPKIVSWLRRLR